MAETGRGDGGDAGSSGDADGGRTVGSDGDAGRSGDRADGGARDDLCDFCRLPCSKGTVTAEHQSTVYEFCSDTCREAMAESDRVFTEYHGFRRIRTGVEGLDRFLPQGFPRNSFVLLSSDEGSRDTALLAELVWRALERDEPAAFVTFTEPPISVVEQFLSLDWNVLPYLEAGELHILDCFTYRVSNRERMFERMNEWNRHLHRITADATRTIRDPSDVSELQNKLDNCLEALGMSDRGIVAVDSLTEFGTLVQPVQAYNFVKDVRADVCKGRFVPIFAGGTVAGGSEAPPREMFPHDLGYAVDGIVDLQLNGDIVEDTLIKRARIRKMNGVLAIPEWTAYEFTAGDGLVAFDPLEEIERTYQRREDDRAESQNEQLSDYVDGDAAGPPSNRSENSGRGTEEPSPEATEADSGDGSRDAGGGE